MEFRPMRRSQRQLSEEAAWTVLEQQNHGVLAVIGDGGWPYAVPINHIVRDGCIYLHCAKEGHKLEAIEREDRMCYTVTSLAKLLPQQMTTAYESVVVFGRAARLEEGSEEFQNVLHAYSYELGDLPPELTERYLAKFGPKTALIRITPEHITGKANHRPSKAEERLD